MQNFLELIALESSLVGRQTGRIWRFSQISKRTLWWGRVDRKGKKLSISLIESRKIIE